MCADTRDPRDEDTSGYITLRKSTLARMGLSVRTTQGEALIRSRFWTDLGYDAADVQGIHRIDRIHPDDREQALKMMEKLRKGELEHGRVTFRIRDHAGEWRWCLSAGMHDIEPESGRELYVGHDQDITYLKQLQQQAEDALMLAEERADEADTLRHAGAIIAASLDKQEMVYRVISQLRHLLPLEHCIVFERQGRELNSLYVDGDNGERNTRSTDDSPPVELFTAGIGFERLLACLRTGLPEVFQDPADPARVWLAVPLVIRGEAEGVCMISRSDGSGFVERDIRTAAAIADFLAIALNNGRLYEGMSHLATTDQLSGLMNRHAFFYQARTMLEGAWRQGAPASCFILDIDYFKRINDEFGHVVGDSVIRAIADRVRSAVRDVDIVGRYGGEEFCVLLPNLASDDAVCAAERVRKAIESSPVAELGWKVTASIGVASVTTAGNAECPGFDQLLEAADSALYTAKNAGRNRVETGAI